jgi:hypothetical protein
MNFSDDECYCLLLACDLFCEEYSPATHGELNHLEKAKAVRDRLRTWHNEQRSKFGHSPCYPMIGGSP